MVTHCTVMFCSAGAGHRSNLWHLRIHDISTQFCSLNSGWYTFLIMLFIGKLQLVPHVGKSDSFVMHLFSMLPNNCYASVYHWCHYWSWAAANQISASATWGCADLKHTDTLCVLTLCCDITFLTAREEQCDAAVKETFRLIFQTVEIL